MGIEVLLLVSRLPPFPQSFSTHHTKNELGYLRATEHLPRNRTRGRKFGSHVFLYKLLRQYPKKQRLRMVREISSMVLGRPQKLCNFLEWKGKKKAYYILDELIIGGELQETSKREVLRVAAAQDELMEDDKDGKGRKGSRR